MKRFLINVLCLLFLPLSPDGLAVDRAWLMSIPYAISSQHIYKVVIETIDGQPGSSALKYPLAAGEHTITVSLQLDVEWSPDLVETPGTVIHKPLKLVAEAGKTYQLAGRVNVDAPAESQLDGSFWEAVVFRTLDN